MEKKLLFVATLFSLNAKSQTSIYHPFPEDSATWISDSYGNFCSGYCASTFYEMNGDTIINSQLYNKIYGSLGDFYYITPPLFPNPGVVGATFSACSYIGGIRQDSINKKVYFIDSTMSTDTLLYDFDLSIGDTIESWYNKTNIQFPLVVSGTDSVLVNNNYHKFYSFTNMPQGLGLNLIEGVGWSGDLFGILWSPDGVIRLSCFNGNFLNGGNFSNQQAFNNECNPILSCRQLTNLENHNHNISLSVSPNPFSEKLNFTINNNQLSEIIIYDISSRKLLFEKFINSIMINAQKLEQGIYIYEIRTKDGLYYTGKVWKD